MPSAERPVHGYADDFPNNVTDRALMYHANLVFRRVFVQDTLPVWFESVYPIESDCWFILFQNPQPGVEDPAERIVNERRTDPLSFKKGINIQFRDLVPLRMDHSFHKTVIIDPDAGKGFGVIQIILRDGMDLEHTEREIIIMKDRTVMRALGEDQDLRDPGGIFRLRIPDVLCKFCFCHMNEYNINTNLTYNE